MVYNKTIEANSQKAENVISAFLHKADINGKAEITKNKITESTRNISKAKISSICCVSLYMLFGLIFCLLGLLTIINPIYQWALNEEMKFSKGLPSFEVWAKNDVIIRCKVHVFNFTNVNEFTQGIDKKLKVIDIGEIIFNERELITNTVHIKENSTFSYNIKRVPEFIEEWNKPGILNETITVPNIPLLFMVSFLLDSNYFTKMGFNFMSKNDPLFINTTIYNYLFNFTTPALNTADKYFSFLLPSNNVGLLKSAHETKPEGDNINVNVGIEKGPRNFFKMNTFNYRTTVPGYHLEHNDCNASILNSTEGNIYGTSLEKDEILYYWRKSVCRAIPLYYEREVQEGNNLAYRFIAKSSMYDRLDDPEKDCYMSYDGMSYPSGLSDASKCYHGLPVAMSLPHFYGNSNGFWNDKVEGYTPLKEEHTSFAHIEPITGIPLHQRARTQSNLVLPKLNGYRREMDIFSNMVIPLMWLEYSVEELTSPILALITFVVKILPIAQYILPVFFIVLGILLIYLGARRIYRNKKQNLAIKLIHSNSNTYLNEKHLLDEINDVCLDLDSDYDENYELNSEHVKLKNQNNLKEF